MVLQKLSQTFKISLALMLSVLSTGLLQTVPAYALNNPGDIKVVDELGGSEVPNNEPMLTDCDLGVELYNFDNTTNETATVTFTGQAPTDDVTINVTGNQSPVVPGDGDTDGNGRNDADGAHPYTLSFVGAPKTSGQMTGYHVKVSVDVTNTNGGAKTKVFWMPASCEQTGNVIPTVTTCPAVLGTNHSTNLNNNGWTLPADAEYVNGGIKLNVSGDWDETYIQRSFVGPLANIGSEVDFTANPSQYAGIHIVTSKGTLVYEKEGSYAGKWWSTSDFGAASGMGYATFDTLENIVAANPGVTTSLLRVLYTSPTAASSTVTSVTVGCTVYTFDKETVPVTTCPATLPTSHSTNLNHNGWTLIRGAEYVDGGMKLSTPGEWVSGKISRTMTGTLADLGNVVSYSPDAPYLGLHIETEEGWLTYETVYGGNWWLSGATDNMMDNAPHNGGGQGSPYYGTLEEWAEAFPELKVLSLVVLYTNEVPANTTVTSVKIGCVEYTFDKVDAGQGGGQVNGDTTVVTPAPAGQTLSAATVALPATLPETGNATNPFMIMIASLVAYGAAYFLQGRRQIANKLDI